jgi:hypothetical protein
MRTLIIPVAAVAALAFSACGGDDGGLSGDRQEAVDQLVSEAESAGVELDRSCIEEIAGDLSDEDAAAIVAAGPSGAPELSAEGQAVTDRLFSCVDSDGLADMMIASLESSGVEVDADCVREAMADFDPAELAGAADGEMPDEVFEALFACADLSGG